MVSDQSLVKKRLGSEKGLELCSGLRPEYSFGEWTRDIQNWVRVAELHVQQQASASVFQLWLGLRLGQGLGLGLGLGLVLGLRL